MIIYWIGLFMGSFLFAAKFGTFWMLTGGDQQWHLPFTGAIGVRDWIYKNNVRKGLLDIFGGWVGAHVLVAMGAGSIIGLLAMCTYIIICSASLFGPILVKKACKSLVPVKTKKRRRIPCY